MDDGARKIGHGIADSALPEHAAVDTTYERLLRPLLFKLEPETAHNLAQFALAREYPWSKLRPRQHRRLAVKAGNLTFASPIGLAAGFDKNGDAVPGLQHLGFGYLCVGSILPSATPGHPRPRLLRYPEREAMVNCYGLPSDGLAACVAKFKRLAARKVRSPLIANIHTEGVASYAECAAALAPYAAGIELALRCPNRSGHISVYPIEDLDELLATLTRQCPDTAIFVKLPPYANEEEKANRLALVERAIHFNLAGVTIPGNWNVEEERLSRGSGSLSGRPTFATNLKIVREMAEVTKGRIAIKASGGVHTGKDAFELLQAGATMIDIFTAMIYRGWSVVAKIEAELLALMRQRKIATVSDLIAGRSLSSSPS